MCRCTAQPNALRPCVEIFAEAVVVFALAWLEKKNNNNSNNNNQKEDEHSGVYVSWLLTTLAKLSVDVRDVFSHELSLKAFSSLVRL